MKAPATTLAADLTRFRDLGGFREVEMSEVIMETEDRVRVSDVMVAASGLLLLHLCKRERERERERELWG